MQSQTARVYDPDEGIREVVAERPGTIKIRVQPTLLRKDGQYRNWQDVRWLLECDSADEAFAARDAMRVFFEVMTRCGPTAVRAALGALTRPHPTTTPTTTTKPTKEKSR
jgi:hypothetical protein